MHDHAFYKSKYNVVTVFSKPLYSQKYSTKYNNAKKKRKIKFKKHHMKSAVQ